jgi:FkbM family methyltransferase
MLEKLQLYQQETSSRLFCEERIRSCRVYLPCLRTRTAEEFSVYVNEDRQTVSARPAQKREGKVVIDNLIYDIGMHIAEDTEFYLKKGFRVVAVEANPKLCREAEMRLATYIDDQRLIILNRGVSSTPGLRDFFVNLNRSDWSSFVANWCPSDEKVPITVESVRVECVRLDDILAEFGIPYYLKIDIEGLDYVCVEALERQRAFPRFVSAETSKDHFVHRMSELGYKRFKLISQVWNQTINLPRPAIEGEYVDQRFTAYHSGPFGNETYGAWLSKDEILDEISKAKVKNFEESRHKLFGCPEEAFVDSWFDVHAKLG